MADSSDPELIDAGTMPPLRLVDFEQMALAHHPGIETAHARIAAAEGRQVQVGLRNNPVISYQGSELGELGGAGKQGGFVSQEVITGHKRRYAVAELDAEIDRLEQKLSTIQSRVNT